MDLYDVLVFGLLVGTLGCFWRAWRIGELREMRLTIRRCLEHGVHLAR
jgi:hypothetical protein